MSLGLVAAYGDSDDEDDSHKNVRQSTRPPAPSPATIRPDFRRPPPPLFPGVTAQSNPMRKPPPATYAQMVERDEKGRVRVTAPRLEDHDSDEEDQGRQFKKPKMVQNIPGASNSGLMAVLPKPEGPKRKGEASKESGSSFDQMLARKKKESSTTETIKVQGASQIRYEAEMKKAELLQKYMKKTPVEEPEYDEDDEQDYSHPPAMYPPAEPDYLGLNHRAVGNVHFAEPRPSMAPGEEEIGWEVDQSAYEEDSYDEGAPGAFQYAEPPPPVFGLQPGAVWTANYKYQDVQHVLDNPRMMGHAPPQPGYTTNQQAEKLIARYEPELQEYINRGHHIDIVDVRADDHLGDPRANVMRQLTEQEANPPSRPMVIKGKVNKTAKQKGQITFLAAQAVARESELQNEWSRNRQARQAASNRYGF